MPLKLIPEYVSPNYDPVIFNKSTAEFDVYKLFQKSSRSGYLLHSLNCSKHEYKEWAEGDFVLITEFGVICLEVKGGIIKRQNGRWYSGKYMLSEDPHDQIQAVRYQLEKHLNKKLDCEFKINYGWGVIFPDSNSDKRVQDTGQSFALQACDMECKNAGAFDVWLNALEKYWHNQWSKQRGNKKRKRADRTLTESQQKKIQDILRPDFWLSSPIGRRVDKVKSQIFTYTNDQLKALEGASRIDRLIVTGGAGTGKTILAREFAKAECAKGSSVLFVARNKHLIKKLQNENEHDKLDFLVFDELKSKSEGKLWDVLVVDEGQDLLSDDYLIALGDCIRGGLGGGRWRWMMDANYQAGFYKDTDLDSVKELEDFALIPPYELVTNCRNTKQIVQFVQLCTGAYIGEAKLQGDGPSPVPQWVANKEQERTKITHQLAEWIQGQEVKPSDITLIKIDEEADTNLTDSIANRVQCYSNIDFKGLESPFVIVFGVTRGETLSSLESDLYTACSRGSMQLFVVLPKELKPEWQQMLLDRMSAVTDQNV